MDLAENPYATSVLDVSEDADVNRPSLLAMFIVRVVSLTVGGISLVVTVVISLSLSHDLLTSELLFVLGMGTIFSFVFGVGTYHFLLQMFREPISDREFFGASAAEAKKF